MTSLNRDFTGSNFPGSDLHQDDLRTESLQTLQQYMSPPSGNLMDYDWDQLQEEYIASMEKHENAERDLRNRVAKLLEVFTAVINLVAFI